MTLIEVLAALTIAGSLLVAVMIARARVLRQTNTAERRLAAVREADRLVRTWWSAATGIPPAGSGELPTNLRWQTRLVENADARQLGAQVVQMTIQDTQSEAEKPLVELELLIPEEKDAH
jgi:type II secretory pathway pseudopilin PulG